MHLTKQLIIHIRWSAGLIFSPQNVKLPSTAVVIGTLTFNLYSGPGQFVDGEKEIYDFP